MNPLALWIVGAACSGKTTLANRILERHNNFKIIDPDIIFEKILDFYDLGREIKVKEPSKSNKKPVSVKELSNPMDYFHYKEPSINGAKTVATEITKREMNYEISQMNNLMIVNTGVQVGQNRKLKERLESTGYRTKIIHISIEDVDMLESNSTSRFEHGGRKIDREILKKSIIGQEKVKSELLPLFTDCLCLNGINFNVDEFINI